MKSQKLDLGRKPDMPTGGLTCGMCVRAALPPALGGAHELAEAGDAGQGQAGMPTGGLTCGMCARAALPPAWEAHMNSQKLETQVRAKLACRQEG